MVGLFIVFEGGDGAGKSTQVELLAYRFRRLGINPVVTRQPGGTPLGVKLRDLLLDIDTGELDPRAEALLYAADKAQHVNSVIMPVIEQGGVVISDRFTDSMLAYQGAGRRLGVPELTSISDWATYKVKPDLTVVIDVDPSQAVERIADKDRLEGESLEFHRRVRNVFLKLARQRPGNYLVLPAFSPRQQMANQIWAKLLDLGLVEPSSKYLAELPEVDE